MAISNNPRLLFADRCKTFLEAGCHLHNRSNLEDFVVAYEHQNQSL